MFSGRLSAIPSWSWRIQPVGKGSFLRRGLKRGQRMVLNWRDFYVDVYKRQEQVFSYPGLGQAAVTAGLGSDLPLLMAVAVTTALIVFGGNMLADILYGVVDPRIRRGGRGK